MLQSGRHRRSLRRNIKFITIHSRQGYTLFISGVFRDPYLTGTYMSCVESTAPLVNYVCKLQSLINKTLTVQWQTPQSCLSLLCSSPASSVFQSRTPEPVSKHLSPSSHPFSSPPLRISPHTHTIFNLSFLPLSNYVRFCCSSALIPLSSSPLTCLGECGHGSFQHSLHLAYLLPPTLVPTWCCEK